MKSIITSILSLVCVLCGFSQSATYSDFTASYFHGIKTEDGKLFYTAYYGEPKPDTPYNVVIQIFDSELQRVVKERVDVKYNSDIADIASHKGGLLVYIHSGEDGLIYYYDDKGQKVWNKKLVRDKGKFNEARLVSLGEKGFAIVRPDKQDDDGFRVTLYNDQLNEKWSVGQYPEKGNLEAWDVKAAGDKIAILSHYQKSIFSNKYEEKIHVFSAVDGKEIYQQSVATEADNGKPQEIKVNPDGSSFVMGYYVDRFKEEAAQDLYYRAYDATGKLLFDQKFSMKDELTDKLLSDRAKKYFGFKEAPLIHIEKIIKTNEGYQVLGETYKYVTQPVPTGGSGTTVSTTTPGKLFVMDYVILNISGTGKLNEVKTIAKPYKRISTEGHLVSREIYADEYFSDFNLFAYRFTDESSGKPELVSLNWNHNMPYIGYTSTEVDHENILNRTYLNKSVSERNSGNVTDYLFKKEGVQRPLQTYTYNYLPYYKPGKVLFYEFEGGELLMEIRDNKVELAKPANGELALSGIPASQFKGLNAIEGRGYYTFYESEEGEKDTRLYVYHKLNNDLSTLGRSVLTVPSSAYFTGNVANGEGQVVVFQDRAERAWYFYSLDANGTLTGQNRIALATTANQIPSGNLLLEPAADGFYIVQPYIDTAREIPGYQVMRLNGNREVRWSWAHDAGTDEALQIISTGGGNGLFSVIHNQHPYNKYDQVTNTLIALDDQTGKQVIDHDLFDGEDAAFPEYIKEGNDKSLVTSGMYFKGKNFNATNSAGLFFLKLSSDGSQVFYTKTPWDKVETQLQVSDVQNFLISGKTKVLIEDMVLMPDGSYKVIGELYRKSAGTTGWGFLLGDDLGDRAFSIYDFVVFDYGKTGQLSGVYRIPKEEQNIEVAGGTGQQRGLALSLMMRRYNMFSYLKTMKEGEKPKLIFTNTVNGEKRVYKAPVAKSQVKSFPNATASYVSTQPAQKMNKLEMMDSKLEKLGNDLDKALTGTDQTFTTFKDPYRGFAVSVPGEVLVYFYNPEAKTLNIKLEQIK